MSCEQFVSCGVAHRNAAAEEAEAEGKEKSSFCLLPLLMLAADACVRRETSKLSLLAAAAAAALLFLRSLAFCCCCCCCSAVLHKRIRDQTPPQNACIHRCCCDVHCCCRCRVRPPALPRVLEHTGLFEQRGHERMGQVLQLMPLPLLQLMLRW